MSRAFQDEQLLEMLRMVAPGMPLREGLDSILRGRIGALIVVGDGPEVAAMSDGGFRLDTAFHPASLYELAKMDGAIILSADGKKIVRANVHLNPDPSTPSSETGIRHRTAERVARQTGTLVIAISARRNVISVYRANLRYLSRDVAYLLAVANQALQTLERSRDSLNKALLALGALEFEDLVVVADVVRVLQKAHTTLRVVAELERYATELGEEGRLIAMQLERLSSGVEEEAILSVRDYCRQPSDENCHEVHDELKGASRELLTEGGWVARRLGFGPGLTVLDTPVSPRGYRLLRRIPRLPIGIIDNLVKKYGLLSRIIAATPDELDGVEGIGEARALAILQGLTRLREVLRRSPERTSG